MAFVRFWYRLREMIAVRKNSHKKQRIFHVAWHHMELFLLKTVEIIWGRPHSIAAHFSLYYFFAGRHATSYWTDKCICKVGADRCLPSNYLLRAGPGRNSGCSFGEKQKPAFFYYATPRPVWSAELSKASQLLPLSARGAFAPLLPKMTQSHETNQRFLYGIVYYSVLHSVLIFRTEFLFLTLNK